MERSPVKRESEIATGCCDSQDCHSRSDHRCQLGAAGDVELAEDVAHMGFQSLNRYLEPLGRLAIGVAAGDTC